METSNLKNMVVLKNLPSNLIDEAIVVLKKNINVKEFEPQNNADEKINEIKSDGKKDYIVKEAEMLVNSYISNMENNKKKEQLNQKIGSKYKKMKKYLCSVSIITIIEFILLLIK